MPTLTERRDSAHQRSVALYLQRQSVEAQRQQMVQQAQAIDLELVRLDGEIRLLDALIAEDASGQ